MAVAPSCCRRRQGEIAQARHSPRHGSIFDVKDPKPTVTDEELWELIEDYVLTEVLRDRLDEVAEPWDEMNQGD